MSDLLELDHTWDSRKAIRAQQEYCDEHRLPIFAPHDGRCPACFEDIYHYPGGYSVGWAGHNLVTACPFCATSYVE